MVCIPTLLFLLEEWSIAEADDTFTMIFLVEEASVSEAALAPSPDICAREVCIFEVALPLYTWCRDWRRGPCWRFLAQSSCP